MFQIYYFNDVDMKTKIVKNTCGMIISQGSKFRLMNHESNLKCHE